jgi:hypothetical protein
MTGLDPAISEAVVEIPGSSPGMTDSERHSSARLFDTISKVLVLRPGLSWMRRS